jgi:hypothetical protein
LPKKAVKPKAAKTKNAKTPKKTAAKKPAAEKKAAKPKAKKPTAAKKPAAKPAKKANRLFLYIRIYKGVVLVSMYIFYLFDFFLFSVLEKREKIWHWDKAGFRFVKYTHTKIHHNPL